MSDTNQTPADTTAAVPAPADAADLFGKQGPTQVEMDDEANEETARHLAAKRAGKAPPTRGEDGKFESPGFGKPKPQPTTPAAPAAPPIDKPAVKADDGGGNKTPAAPDPFAALPEPVKTRLAEFEGRATKAERERLAAVHKLQQVQREMADLRKQPVNKPPEPTNPAPTAPPDASAQALKQVEDDYPELKPLVGYVRQVVAAYSESEKARKALADTVTSLQTRLDGEIAPAVTRFASGFESIQERAARDTITQAHPKAYDHYKPYVNDDGEVTDEEMSPLFASWLYAQPRETKEKRFSGDPQVVAEMFAAFAQWERSQTGAPAIDPAESAAASAKAESRRRNLEAAVAPDIRPTPAPKPIRSLDDFEDENDATAFLLEQKRRARGR